MKVRTRLQIGSILPVILALAVGAVLIVLYSHLDDVKLKIRAADGVIREVFKVDIAAYRYQLKPGPETEQAWLTAHSRLGELLERETVVSPEQADVFKKITKYHSDMKGVFQQLTARRPATIAEGTPVKWEEPEHKLLEQLWADSQSMVSDAIVLAANTNQETVAMQNSAYLLIIGVTALLAIVLFASGMLLSRSIATGVAAVRKATDSIAEGKLNHEIQLTSNDEIADLGKAFNRMTADLKNARESLKAEIDEKEKVAQSLRDSNIKLSDAFVRLRRAQTEMVQQERIEALRQISRGIVHDVNDSLMPILGLSEFYIRCPEQLSDTAELQESLEAIYQAAKNATATARHLSEFFYPVRGDHRRVTDINHLVEDTMAVASSFLRNRRDIDNVDVKIKLNLGEVPLLSSNATLLRQALTNILHNAVEAMKESGNVTVTTKVKESMAVIEISDTGTGMEPDVGRRCFEPFFSTRGGSHSGMGLTVARGLINRCHGSVSAKGESDDGTTITIRLPLVPPTEMPVAEQEPTVPVKLRILAVDDEVWTTKVLTRHLQVDGHTVDTANRGQQALDKFSVEKHDLVIIDRAMPDMSGDEVAAGIKKLSPQTPTIMLTGFGQYMKDSGELPRGVDAILSKPMMYEELKETMAAVLGK
jgi:signal transduction histidine kinase